MNTQSRYVILSLLLISSGLWTQSQMLVLTSPTGHVSVPHAASLVPSTALTVEAWVYIDPTNGGVLSHPTICRKNAGNESYILRIDSGFSRNVELILRITGLGLVGIQSTGAPLPLFQWRHVAATYDGTSAKIYVNGSLVHQQAVSGTIESTGGALLIGQGNSTSEKWFGYIDEMRIWSDARTESQILESMGASIDGMPGLVAAWHFNGSYNSLTGNHVGTPVGAASLAASTSPVQSVEVAAPLFGHIGATIAFELRGLNAGQLYIFDVSITGTSPGIVLPSPSFGIFPLNPPLLNLELGPFPMFHDFVGTAGSDGRAFTSIDLPPNPNLVGLQLSSAFVAMSSTQTGVIESVSDADTTTISDFGPIVQSVTPTTSPDIGNRSITIQGEYFGPGAVVFVGSSQASQVVVVNSTTITCVTPPGPPGPAVITVTNTDEGSGSLPGVFSYIDSLELSSVSPLGAAAGTIVTIAGAGFQQGMTLDLGGLAVSPTSITNSTVTFTMPVGVSCNEILTVVNPDGQTAMMTLNPSVPGTYLVPPFGPATGGTNVFILGNQLDAVVSITFGGVTAPILGRTNTAILVAVPPGSIGPVSVALNVLGGCGTSLVYFYQ